MKIRLDFVTNSSSSSYTVQVNVLMKDGKIISYDTADIFEPEGLNYSDVFLTDYSDIIKKTGKASSVEDLCNILRDCLLMYYYESWENKIPLGEYLKEIEDDEDIIENLEVYYEDLIEYNEKIEKAVKKFKNKIRRNCKSLGDIDKIQVCSEENNTGECCRGDSFNDVKLVELARKIMDSKGEKQKEVIKEFEEYINNHELFVLKREAIYAAEDLCEGNSFYETISEVEELDVSTGEVKKYEEYYV